MSSEPLFETKAIYDNEDDGVLPSVKKLKVEQQVEPIDSLYDQVLELLVVDVTTSTSPRKLVLSTVNVGGMQQAQAEFLAYSMKSNLLNDLPHLTITLQGVWAEGQYYVSLLHLTSLLRDRSLSYCLFFNSLFKSCIFPTLYRKVTSLTLSEIRKT